MTSAAIWKIYLLLCHDGTFYCGICNNMERRLAQHNGFLPGGAKYTRCRRPVSLLGFKACENKSAALKVEYQVKRMSRPEKLAFFKDRPHA